MEAEHHNFQAVAAVGTLKEAWLDEVIGVAGGEVDPAVGQAVAVGGEEARVVQLGWTGNPLAKPLAPNLGQSTPGTNIHPWGLGEQAHEHSTAHHSPQKKKPPHCEGSWPGMEPEAGGRLPSVTWLQHTLATYTCTEVTKTTDTTVGVKDKAVLTAPTEKGDLYPQFPHFQKGETKSTVYLPRKGSTEFTEPEKRKKTVFTVPTEWGQNSAYRDRPHSPRERGCTHTYSDVDCTHSTTEARTHSY